MTTAFDLRVMGLLLRQGRKAHAVSLGLAAFAATWLLVLPASTGTTACLWLGLAASVLELHYATRVDFDASLLFALAGNAVDDDACIATASAIRIDHSLQSLGLLRPGKTGRDWPSRWRAMRRLLTRQVQCLATQATSLVVASALPTLMQSLHA